jgi:hypothetical protein
MASWTPQQLTNPDFIKTLSPQDRNVALKMARDNQLTQASILEKNKSDLATVQEEKNSITRASIAEARASGDIAKAEALQKRKDELAIQETKLLANVSEGDKAVAETTVGASNLEQAGAIAANSVYSEADGTLSRPAYGPDTTNPNVPTPAPESPSVNTSPATPTVEAQLAADPNAVTPAYPGDSPGGSEPTPIVSGLALRDETGAVSTLRKNPETGELYTPVPGSVPEGFADEKTVDTPGDAGATTGTAYDDEGNLNPGWSLDENNNPVYVGAGFVEPATSASAAQSRADAAAASKAAQAKAVAKAKAESFQAKDDWRVRLSLSPKADYLYRAAKPQDILYPLQGTDGVVFPYTPTINTNYRANYEAADITHTNYKTQFYKNSTVEDVSITAEFTAQDTVEANYLLAVIHFFKSATKMFYGRDVNPRAGTPPPLLYLTGYGAFQFDNHPLALSNFQYNLPNDVDYIRAGTTNQWAGQNIQSYASKAPTTRPGSAVLSGLTDIFKPGSGKLPKGGVKPASAFNNASTGASLSKPAYTYVPTKISLTLTLIPIVTRRDISQTFSLKEYATGSLLRGSKRNSGGIW